MAGRPRLVPSFVTGFVVPAAVALHLLAGCGGDEPTSLVIEVTSPLTVPDDIDGLEISVVGATSGQRVAEDFALESGWPQTMTVQPGREEDEAVRITVIGKKGDTHVVRRVVDDGFIAGTSHVVEVVLYAACAGVSCPVGIDCTPDGECTEMPDGGRMDASMDAAMDAAMDAFVPFDGPMPDTGPGDAGTDAGCGSAADCDDGVDCTVDSCEAGACVNTPDDFLCELGSTCDPVAGCPARTCTADTECDDGLTCNGVETCESDLCARGTPPTCDDSIDCTADSCDDTMGGCIHETDDSACDDGMVCNGDEICSLTEGCVAADPVSCDDGDDCTGGVCVESAGMCVFTTRDADMDGHGSIACSEVGGVPADDCDDTNDEIFPGAPEICNGTDDNCDGACDESFTCCAGETGSCTTSCGSTGTRVCSAACGWSVCAAPSETCNGIDDDCNGACDDGFECCQGEVTSCTTSCGTTGTLTCDGGCNLGTCEPPLEACNEIDDDCDGSVDEAACGACTDDPDCDDGNPCNGAEFCERGGCTPGTPPSCDDGVTCTVDSCDPTSGCVHTPDDRFCDDSNFCNGAETCTATGCQPGTPPSCDDSDACTEDSCGGGSGGMCLYATLDADNDGFGDDSCSATGGVPATDCDDTRASVFPGAPELCNARDDDCDGAQDETFTCVRGVTGSCTTSCDTTGTRVCTASCSWGVCSPPPETCNGSDDDCNGVPDDGFACVAGATRGCTTACGSTGTQTCSGSSCTWGACVVPSEACNGADDDCDGSVDEGFGCAVGSTTTCTTSCSTTGTRTCGSTCNFGACTPPAEACNGIDDDCDGAVDETVECALGDSQSCTTSCGSTGTQDCNSMCTWDTCVPPAETCNGIDDDCDGTPDDGFTCVAGAGESCSTSCGSTGTRMCDSTCSWGSCVPPAEVCNGADDDCDGSDDEGFTCVQGASGSCTTSCGSTGSRTCRTDCTWGTCSPPTETCNGSDDDCDGLVDEDFTCVPGTTGSCTSGCGTTGSRTCTSSCTWGSCTPPGEVCNGTDDNCDGTCDDGFSCCAGSSGSCTTSCGTTGTRTCSASCGWSACSPPAETCNGVDDDCNTVCDDGFACCAGTTGSCTTSCGSTGTRTCSASCGWGSCNAPAETCNGADDDCDSSIDETFTCIRGETRSCTTSCSSTGTETCAADCSGFGACAPPAESCNGVDDDCDSSIDEGCGGCTACVGATTVSDTGGRYQVALGDHALTGSCGGSGSEAYLTVTTTSTSDILVTTLGSGLDTVVYVNDCTCGGTELGCNDDALGYSGSALHLRDMAAGTYNIIVDTKAAMSAMVDVDVYVTAAGAQGDRCGDAVPIPAGTTNISGNTCGLDNDYDLSLEGDCTSSSGGNAEDRVYYFYLPTSTSVTFDGCTSGTSYDTEIYIREVCNLAGTANQVACNGDGCGGSPACNSRYRSTVTTTLGPGLYYFVADGWQNGDWVCPCGDYSFDLSGI